MHGLCISTRHSSLYTKNVTDFTYSGYNLLYKILSTHILDANKISVMSLIEKYILDIDMIQKLIVYNKTIVLSPTPSSQTEQQHMVRMQIRMKSLEDYLKSIESLLYNILQHQYWTNDNNMFMEPILD